ncbi:MAG: hypothetical protein IT244_04965 [Bacteroidia bacterium]|nr:hypothetical protein [Bacteroidia bacterium]
MENEHLDRVYQKQFMELLRNTVPSHLRLADELGQLLNISADSAYRRIRSETDISLTEAVAICQHFGIPLDKLLPDTSNAVTFEINRFTNTFESFEYYLDHLLKDLEWITRFDGCEVFYAAEDLPVFYNFYFPKLSRFKMAYWMKSIQNVTELQGKKVEDLIVPEVWIEKSSKIGELFLKLKSTDLWHEDTIKSVLSQVAFYWDAGFFAEKQTALDVVTELEQLIDMVSKQAEVGKKMVYSKGQFISSDYVMYISDLMIGNNCVRLLAGENATTYLGYNTFNFMHTTGAVFNQQAEMWMQNLIAKSTLISQVAEKARNQFFKQNLHLLAQLRQKIEGN